MTSHSATNARFTTDTEQFRRELLAHCYRLLGSVDEAEDLVQETYLRAWRSYAGFEGRSSVRVWLYRIATNVCLTALGNRTRRVLPSGLGGPTDDPDAPTPDAGPEVSWLEPFPDTLTDPAMIVADRNGLRLALIASLQYLPARQRAVLILRDVLAFSANEVAEILDTSVAAVKSALQRARARLDEVAPNAENLAEPTEPAAQALLAAYIAAFEHSDPALLTEILRKDAAIEVIGTGTWFAGKSTCLGYLARVTGAPGDWRMLPASFNGQRGAIAYVRDAEGVLRAFGIGLLTTTSTHITRITAFGDPAIVERSRLPRDPALLNVHHGHSGTRPEPRRSHPNRWSAGRRSCRSPAADRPRARPGCARRRHTWPAPAPSCPAHPHRPPPRWPRPAPARSAATSDRRSRSAPPTVSPGPGTAATVRARPGCSRAATSGAPVSPPGSTARQTGSRTAATSASRCESS